MALPTNTGAFIHNGVNCTPNVIPTAQSIPMSASDSTSVKDKIDSLPQTVGEVFYGYCNTQPTSGTGYNTWSVTLINGDDFELTEGVTIYVKFEYGEDGTNLLPPVINVNNKGGRPIYYTYANNAGYTPRWMPGQSCILTYDGGRWLLANPQQTAYLTPYRNSTSGLTATDVQGAIDEVHTQLSAIIDVIYPVGSIYLSVTDSTAEAVAARFGGTWVRIAEGETLFGYKSGDTNFGTVGGEGGATSVNIQHSHTVNDHSHTIGGSTGQSSGSTGQSSGSTGGPSTTNTSGPSTTNTGDCTLTINQVPAHSHTVGTRSPGYGQAWKANGAKSVANGGDFTAIGRGGDTAWYTETDSKGGGKAHSHSLNSHTHTLNDHTHSLNSHTHSLNNHTHTLPADTGTKSSLGTNNQLSTTQSIINPYITVYMYKRTA